MSRRIVLILTGLVIIMSTHANAQKLFTGDETRPADAIVLFDGKDLSAWVQRGTGEPAKWKVENGYMEVVPGTSDIYTKQVFGDCQLHVEFWLPLMADARGQARANSGVYLDALYEVQVLDSYGLKPEQGDCGAIYSQKVPDVNACRPPEHWQSYDVIFHAPKFDDKGAEVKKARLTVFHNGVLIHDNFESPGPTHSPIGHDITKPGPIVLQDHGNRIRYRNIWIRPLEPAK